MMLQMGDLHLLERHMESLCDLTAARSAILKAGIDGAEAGSAAGPSSSGRGGCLSGATGQLEEMEEMEGSGGEKDDARRGIREQHDAAVALYFRWIKAV